MHFHRYACHMASLCLMLTCWGCTQPIEPGSDLEDPAEAPEFENLDDYFITGVFPLEGELVVPQETLGFITDADIRAQLELIKIPLSALELTLDKSGEIPRDTASTTASLRDIFMEDNTTYTMDTPAKIDITGSFRMEFTAITITLPGAPLFTGDMTFDAVIVSDNCILGTSEMLLDTDDEPLLLTSPFIATKQRSGEDCKAMMEDAQ